MEFGGNSVQVSRDRTGGSSERRSGSAPSRAVEFSAGESVVVNRVVEEVYCGCERAAGSLIVRAWPAARVVAAAP